MLVACLLKGTLLKSETSPTQKLKLKRHNVRGLLGVSGSNGLAVTGLWSVLVPVVVQFFLSFEVFNELNRYIQARSTV